MVIRQLIEVTDPISPTWIEHRVDAAEILLLLAVVREGADVELRREHERDALERLGQLRVADSGLSASSKEACVRGNYAGTDGAVHTFFGCDSVKVAP